MTQRLLARKILRRLKKALPEAGCSLQFRSPLELLVATILSAQCTDVQVNKVMPTLFERFRSAKDYAEAPLERIEEAIIRATFEGLWPEVVQRKVNEHWSNNGFESCTIGEQA